MAQIFLCHASEDKPQGGSHLAGNCRRRPDHGDHFSEVKDKVGDRPGNAAKRGKRQKPPVAEALGDRTAEGCHPQQIDEKMHPAGMHEHVGHERGDRSG